MIEFMDAYAICQEMGWDWWTYQNQPAPFIEVIRDILKDRNARAKRKK